MDKPVKKKQRRERRVTVRFTAAEYNRLMWLKDTYAGGSLPKWLRYQALEGERRYLK